MFGDNKVIHSIRGKLSNAEGLLKVSVNIRTDNNVKIKYVKNYLDKSGLTDQEKIEVLAYQAFIKCSGRNKIKDTEEVNVSTEPVSKELPYIPELVLIG